MHPRFLAYSRRVSSNCLRAVMATVSLTTSVFAADVLDRDGDGMSDVWQRVHNIASGDTASDPDNDGHDNAQEARAGTNPHNIASRLHAITFTLNTTATTATLTWKSENQKKYDIEYSSNLTTWTHHSYTDGNGNIKTSTITLAAAAQKFYRIRARQTEDDGDFDTLTDWEETLLGTNRALADTDGDGMHDDWEFIQLFNPLANEAFADADGDGVPNVGEFLFGFNPHSATTTPGVLDFNVFPWAADTDDDGLTNQQELTTAFTNPKNADTDFDGMNDGWEVENNLNPNSATGIDGPNGDPDAEGLSNIEEFGNKTKARQTDSDGDNVSDKVEVDQGSDPNDPNDSQPPPDGTVPVVFTFGDGSSSHSERYKFYLTPTEGDTVTRSRENTGYGVVNTRTMRLKVGARYDLTFVHTGTDPRYRGEPNPDYDYELTVVPNPAVVVCDPYAPTATNPTGHPMLGGHSNDDDPGHPDGSFWAAGKTAEIAIPLTYTTEVGFSGAKYWEVISDDAGTTFTAPHWTDSNDDMDATDSGEHIWAAGFTRNTTPSIAGKFKVKALPTCAVIKLKATGSDGINIPATAVTAGNTLTLPATAADQAWANTIKFYTVRSTGSPFVLNWEISFDDGGNWMTIGQTKHTIYVTLNDPVTALRQETLFEIGCRNANGQSADIPAVGSIWNEFSDRSTPRVDGTQMAYWNPVAGSCQSLELMLADPTGNGTCVAWSHLLKNVIDEQGIGGAVVVEVESAFRNDAGLSLDGGATDRGLFLVKDWTFAAAGTAPAFCAPFTHLTTEVTDDNGAAGQGNPNPPGAFFNHFITRYNGQFYDPSYGNGPFASQADWENASLAGYRKVCDPGGGGTPIIADKTNAPAAIETVFTP